MTWVPYILDGLEWLGKKLKEMFKPKEITSLRPPLPMPVPVPEPKRILVVEDNPNDVLLMEMFLKKTGFIVNVATTGEAAEALIHRNGYALAFVDMRLTYMNGWDLIPLIWKKSPHTIVVVTYTEITDLAKIPEPRGMFLALHKKSLCMEEIEDLLGKVKL